MRIIMPEKSDKALKSQIVKINNCDDAIEQFLNFYRKFKTKPELEYKEEDMLLFQYGIYDWHDGNGKEFNFNLTRQFEIPNEDEFLQLSLTLFYPSNQIGEIKSYNTWSTDRDSLVDWEKLIKASEGYLKSQKLILKRYKIELAMT